MLCVAWDGIVKTSVWVGGYRSYFILLYAMSAQLLEVEAILQLQNFGLGGQLPNPMTAFSTDVHEKING